MAQRKRSRRARPYRRRASQSPNRDIAFAFHKNDQIGAADAEIDQEFLSSCFVDTGDIELLEDFRDHRRIILGRTGSGKSALISELKRRNGNDAIEIRPDSLALTYVSNSTILSFFASLGVNLDPFFKLLWRHVITVEVLRHHFNYHVEGKRPTAKSLLQWLESLFQGPSRENKELRESLEYLKNWGESFWQETEFRIKEITSKFENDLTNEMGLKLGPDFVALGGTVLDKKTISEEQKMEITERAQRVVSRAQIEDLRRVIPLLDKVLDDRQKAYFITIDGLDEDWVEDKVRYKLIKALIFTLKDMGRVKNVKAVIALRRDLLERVFRLTRESGFQEEKYQSIYLPLNWTKHDLLKILDKRVDHLVHERTGRRGVGFRNLMPPKIANQDVGSYVVARAERPRDIIAFFNVCISVSVGRSRVNMESLRRAEGEYSRARLRALADEWISDYPSLLEFTKILIKRPPSFKLLTVKSASLTDLCLTIACDNPGANDFLNQLSLRVVNEMLSVVDFRNQLFQTFYKIGLIGLKSNTFEKESWADELGRGFSAADVDDETSVVIHKAYHRALGIRIIN